MWWLMNKKEFAARDKKAREKIELMIMETTDWPADVKLAVVELAFGFDKAIFMTQLPSERVCKLMALSAFRLVAGEHPPEEQREALEKFCAEVIADYLANPLAPLPNNA
jgi:hypothetical protein